MKILFIGPYRQTDGWGEAAKDYLRALSLTSHDIVARPVFMSPNTDDEIQEDLLELEDGYFDTQPDVVIQNVLPDLCDYQHGSRNIALSYVETSHIEHTGWPYKLNLIDEVWTATIYEADILRNSGVTVPVAVVPTPLNTTNLSLDVEPLELPDVDGKFVFYFIGEYIPRKNIKALIQAFHREFHTIEPASLILKLNKMGMSPDELSQIVAKDVNSIKSTMRLYSNTYGYIPELTITDRLTDENMSKLHKLGDCFVQPSFGESMCRPVLDALYMGNQAIVTDHTGMKETVAGFGEVASSTQVPVFSAECPLPLLYTGYEKWSSIDIENLQLKMRQAYNKRDVPDNQSDKVYEKFSHQAIATIMDDIL